MARGMEGGMGQFTFVFGVTSQGWFRFPRSRFARRLGARVARRDLDDGKE